MPEFQIKIALAYDAENLSDERRMVLQPMIEKQIQFSKPDDGTIKMNIVDAEGKIRDNISIGDLVKETNKNTVDNAVPMVSSSTKLSDEQLKLVAEGKLGISNEKEKPDKDAIPGSTLLGSQISLESIASGKTKVDIDS